MILSPPREFFVHVADQDAKASQGKKNTNNATVKITISNIYNPQPLRAKTINKKYCKILL